MLDYKPLAIGERMAGRAKALSDSGLPLYFPKYPVQSNRTPNLKHIRDSNSRFEIE